MSDFDKLKEKARKIPEVKTFLEEGGEYTVYEAMKRTMRKYKAVFTKLKDR